MNRDSAVAWALFLRLALACVALSLCGPLLRSMYLTTRIVVVARSRHAEKRKSAAGRSRAQSLLTKALLLLTPPSRHSSCLYPHSLMPNALGRAFRSVVGQTGQSIALSQALPLQLAKVWRSHLAPSIRIRVPKVDTRTHEMHAPHSAFTGTLQRPSAPGCIQACGCECVRIVNANWSTLLSMDWTRARGFFLSSCSLLPPVALAS